jgi:protein transport protein SEC61 subunit gamma-like protein
MFRLCGSHGVRRDFVNENLAEPAKQFAYDSYRLVQKCSKPEAKEYKKIVLATSIGFAIMGVIGFLVKLVFIPINQLLLG